MAVVVTPTSNGAIYKLTEAADQIVGEVYIASVWIINTNTGTDGIVTDIKITDGSGDSMFYGVASTMSTAPMFVGARIPGLYINTITGGTGGQCYILVFTTN